MQHPEEGIIHAWLDGALPKDEAAAIETHVASCAECAAKVAEARGLIAASSRIVGHLDAVPGKVIPAAPAKRPRFWRNTAFTSAIAAALIFLIKVNFHPLSPDPAGVRELPRADQSTAGVVRPSPTDPMPVAPPPLTRTAQAPLPQEIRPAPAATAVDSVALPRANAAMQKSAITGAPPAAVLAPAPRTVEPQTKTVAPRLGDNVSLSEAVVPSAPLRRARSLASSAAGGSAGGVASVAQRTDAPAIPRALPPSDQVNDQASDTSFVGCYELSGLLAPVASGASLPRTSAAPQTARRGAAPRQGVIGFALDDRFERFALVDEMAPTPRLFGVRQLDAAGRPDRLILGAGWTVENGQALLKDPDGRTILTFTKTGSTVRGVTTSGDRTARVISCRK